jgi:hypothetical protein
VVCGGLDCVVTWRATPKPAETAMPIEITDLRIQELLDRAEISDVVHRYATGLDTQNWPLLRSIFLDEIDMDFA